MAKVPPRNPKYSADDLWPPGSKGVEFPPAAFHPVYLGNFMCQQYSELVPRVQQYFASKGLLARMVFSRGAENEPFRNYQDKTKLYDCLVYFTRPEDAQDAIKYLHRDKYYGHRLNIFPGRYRLVLSPIKTVQVDQLPGVCGDAPAQIFEDEVRRITSVIWISCCVRNTPNQVLVEFQSRKTRDHALGEARRNEGVILTPISGVKIMKQRFIEDDIKQEIRKRKNFVHTLPAAPIRKALLKGRKVPAVRQKYSVRGLPQQPGNHDHVIQAMKRVQMVAAQRQLDINLYRTMYPNAYNQFMAILQASFGDTGAAEFLQTYVPPFLHRPNPLNPWEWRHVELHNEGLEYVRAVVRQREINFSRSNGNEILK